MPPKIVSTSGTIQSGFQTPTTSIQVGNPDVVLVFDTVVTLILNDTTGHIAYKLSGTDEWILISTCLGTFANPTDPPSPGECSISNGIDTKILTYHFTEFAEVTSDSSASTTETTPSSPASSGHGRTRVGPSSHSSITPFIPSGVLTTPPTESTFPSWMKYSLVQWWTEDAISDREFKDALGYLLDKKIININAAKKPTKQLAELPESIKEIFEMWSNEKLPDSIITNLIHHYRALGVW